MSELIGVTLFRTSLVLSSFVPVCTGGLGDRGHLPSDAHDPLLDPENYAMPQLCPSVPESSVSASSTARNSWAPPAPVPSFYCSMLLDIMSQAEAGVVKCFNANSTPPEPGYCMDCRTEHLALRNARKRFHTVRHFSIIASVRMTKYRFAFLLSRCQ